VAGVIGAVGAVLGRVAYGLRSAMGAVVRLSARYIGLGRRRVAGMASVLLVIGMVSLWLMVRIMRLSYFHDPTLLPGELAYFRQT
jgi:hypothetical protein